MKVEDIIKSKINDALHWIAITAASSSVFAESKKISDTSSKISVEDYDDAKNIGTITMDANTEIIAISRVRGKEWFKAVIPVEDTDNEAYMMFDESAMGTADRPQAAIIRENPIRILLQPKPTEAVVSFVGVPKNVDVSSETTDVAITDKLKNAFIYYLAFLLLSAYNDNKATHMYTIALQQLGVNTKQ